jgi:Effector Associated Constant Component 1
MMDGAVRLALTILPGWDADQSELERLTQSLRRDLSSLDVQSVDLVRAGTVPSRAKAGDPVSWGQLIVALAASGGLLTTLIGALQAWLTNPERRSVTVEIDGDKLSLTGSSNLEQQRLIDAWISRHNQPSSRDG